MPNCAQFVVVVALTVVVTVELINFVATAMLCVPLYSAKTFLGVITTVRYEICDYELLHSFERVLVFCRYYFCFIRGRGA